MKWKRRSTVAPQPTAIITEGSELDGKSSFNGSVILNGRAKGDVHATGTLIVGESAFIEAQLRAPVIVIAGHVVGNLSATERVEFRRSAHVVGDLEAPVFVIEAGAVFEGRTTRPTPEGPETGDSTLSPPRQ
jgi:cytoskeletal protein CcmA (bactofilin family)